MKHLLIAFAALGLAACQTIPSIPAPVEVADKTVLDERAVVSVELAYKAARTAVEVAVDAGVIKGERAKTLADLDNTAYRAVLATRAAYKVGNAASYDASLLHAQTVIATMVAILGS